MKWTADFDRAGKVTLTPDTPESRRDLAQTLYDFHSGVAKIERAKWIAPALKSPVETPNG